MAGVVIENLPWQKFIERYDRPGILFYIDPPYWDNEDDYGKRLQPRAVRGRWRKCSAGLKGASFCIYTRFKGSLRRFQWFGWRRSIVSIRSVGMVIANP
jgi:DNA adenine methylase